MTVAKRAIKQLDFVQTNRSLQKYHSMLGDYLLLSIQSIELLQDILADGKLRDDYHQRAVELGLWRDE